MGNLMAAIEVSKLPLVVLLFVLAYWKTAVAALWGVGFVTILVKRMRQWYREDGRDAAVGAPNDEIIYARMKVISAERRGERMKFLFTKGLFWILYWAHATGKKVAKWAFYPILAVMDKAQTKGIEEGKVPGLRRLPVTVTEDVVPAPAAPAVLIEGENASKCVGCGMVVAYSAPHACEGMVVISEPVVKPGRKVQSYKCEDCAAMVQMDQPHKCRSRAGRMEDGTFHCECGAVYKETDDFEHVCPEEGEDLNAECKDCDVLYNPTEEVHIARFCRGCEEVHCKKQYCGHVVA